MAANDFAAIRRGKIEPGMGATEGEVVISEVG